MLYVSEKHEETDFRKMKDLVGTVVIYQCSDNVSPSHSHLGVGRIMLRF